MKNISFLIIALLFAVNGFGQSSTVFQSSFKKFTEDPAFTNSLISLYVVNSNSGQSVLEQNINVGIVPASTQKIITAATAYELLGKNFTYTTTLSYSGILTNGLLNGDIIIKGNGDPTLGSALYQQTKEELLLKSFTDAISKAGIRELKGNVILDESGWPEESVPEYWIWQDLGNYFGAPARAINWRENQFDLYLKSGNNIGDPVEITGTHPEYISGLNLISEVTAAAKGSGDKTNIFLPYQADFGLAKGTIPVNENKFKVSGSMPQPSKQLALKLESLIKKLTVETIEANYPETIFPTTATTLFYTYKSPGLDSIIFYFLRRSNNLFGEALLKSIGNQAFQKGSTESGIKGIQEFWKKKGIQSSALKILDGSGLSPANRVSAKSLVIIMNDSRKQNWFPSFYNALPEISGFKMKSGTIGGVVSYTGYLKGKNGADYTFAFVINNYDGSAGEVRRKMWKLLGEL